MNTDNGEMHELTGSELDLVAGGDARQVIIGIIINLATDAVKWVAGEIAGVASSAVSSANSVGAGYMSPGSHYGPY